MKQYFLITICLFSMCSSVVADNWPQWRGPPETASPKTEIFDRFFQHRTRCLEGEASRSRQQHTHRLGRQNLRDQRKRRRGLRTSLRLERWIGLEKTLGPERPGKHHNGSGANSSPITDGKNLYVYFKSGTVASFTMDGKLNWQINLQKKFGEDTLWWDLGTSPVPPEATSSLP